MFQKIRERLYKLKSRLYIEGQYLNDADFQIGQNIKYRINKRKQKVTVVLSDNKTSNKVAQTTVRSGKVVPVIDIKTKEIRDFFDTNSDIEVSIYKGRIIFTVKEEVSSKVIGFKRKSIAIPIKLMSKAVGWEQPSLFELFNLTTSETTSSNFEDIIEKKVGKTLRLLSLFSGIGSFEKALTRQNISYELVNYCEIDRYASKAYSLIHNISESLNLWDVRKVCKENINGNVDAMTWGFPCFEAGMLVMTSTGYKKIEDITENDYVLTHTNQFQKVIKPMKKFCTKIYEFESYGVEKFKVTEEHPFYARTKKKIWNSIERSYIRTFEEPMWVKTKDLNKNYYIGVAINQKSELPKWEGYTYMHQGKKEKRIKNLDFNNERLWWIIGRYIGDGWRRISKRKNKADNFRTIICCKKSEISDITSKLDGLFKYSIAEERTVYKIHIVNKELTLYLEQFKDGAKNKILTSDIFNLPVDLLEQFINGYFSADGCFTQGKYKAESVSKELIYGMQSCIHKVYKRPCALYYNKRNQKCTIEGRVVNQSESWQIAFKKENSKQDKAFYENGYIWIPFKSKKLIEYNDFVYNMSVENDESYTVYNLIVHNCTDLSNAGLQKGFVDEDGNITRSGLYYEGIRILKMIKPKFSIIENVKALISKKFTHEYNMILSDLDKAGYNSYSFCYNAADFKIPQHRERIFIVSIRKDIDTHDFNLLPVAHNTPVKLKDFLVNGEIANKYYLKDSVMAKFKEKLSINSKTNIVSVGQVSNDGSQSGKVYSIHGNFPTICACTHGYALGYIMIGKLIRRLIPVEVARLMGFDDNDIEKCQNANISDSQLYKMLGNSIVVNVLEYIFGKLFKDYKIDTFNFAR